MPAFGPCRRACGCAGLFFLPPDSAVLSVFAALLFAPSFFPSSVFLSVFRLSSRLPFFFPSSVFLLPARISHCPCLSLPVSPSVRVSLSPQLPSFVGSSSVVCIPSGFSSVISCFSVHRPSLAACCPSPVAPSIVQRLPLVVRRPLSIPCRPLSVARCAVHRSSPAACWRLPVPRTPPRRASFRCRSVRITAFVSAESRPACLRELLAVSGSVGRSFRKNAPPLRTLVAAPFLTGAPDPQGGRIPAARKENGKNINN